MCAISLDHVYASGFHNFLCGWVLQCHDAIAEDTEKVFLLADVKVAFSNSCSGNR